MTMGMCTSKCMKGCLLGAITLFVWMNISWMAIGWHQAYMKSVPGEAALSQALKSSVKESGLYFIPHMAKGDDQEAFKSEMQSGPFAKMVIYPEGKPFNMGKMMFFGFLFCLLASALLNYLLCMTSGLSLMKKVMFCELVGFVGTSQMVLANWNWWGFPCLYVIVMLVDAAIAYSLVGFVLGKFVHKD